MEQKKPEKCVNCHKKACFRCSCCVVSPYCTIECQTNDWERHRKECRKIGILSSPIVLWNKTITPPMKVHFEVLVQYVQSYDECTAVAWVIETRYLQIFEKLTTKRKETIPNGIEQLENVKKDMLVMNWYDGKFQRARVCQVYLETKVAVIRFIDTGTSKVAPLAQLMRPTLEMERTMALAFTITLISGDTKSLKEGYKLWIKTLGSKAPNGSYHAVQMPIFFGFPFVTAKEKTQVKLVRFFEDNQAGIFRAIDGEKNTPLPSSFDDLKTLAETPGEGSFILAMYAKQWERGRLIGWSDMPDVPHLVYLFDLGKMCFSKTLKPLPKEFQAIKMHAFVIFFEELYADLAAAADIKFANLSIAVNSKAMKMNAMDRYVPSLPCQLYNGDDKKLGIGKAQNFSGFLESIDLNYWKETICDGTVVVIKSFVNEKCLAISPAWTCKYRKLFADMSYRCVRRSSAAIEDIVDDISLAYNIKHNYFFRAQYISQFEKFGTEYFEVMDIDTGKFENVTIIQLFELNRFLRSCPVYLTYIELTGVEASNLFPKDSKSFETLTRYCDNATEFVLKYDGNGTQTAKLFYRASTERSLNAKLMEFNETQKDANNNSTHNTLTPNGNMHQQYIHQQILQAPMHQSKKIPANNEHEENNNTEVVQTTSPLDTEKSTLSKLLNKFSELNKKKHV